MNMISVSNTLDNHSKLINMGLTVNDISGKATYLLIYLDKQLVVGCMYIGDIPWLDIEQIAPLLLLPDCKTRTFYLLKEKLITRFNPLINKEYLSEYYTALNSVVLQQSSQ